MNHQENVENKQGQPEQKKKKVDESRKKIGNQLLEEFRTFAKEKGTVLSGIRTSRELLQEFSDWLNEKGRTTARKFLRELLLNVQDVDDAQFFDAFFAELGGYHLNVSKILQEESQKFYEDLSTKNNRQAMFLLVRDQVMGTLNAKEKELFVSLYGSDLPLREKTIDQIDHRDSKRNYLIDLNTALQLFLGSSAFAELYGGDVQKVTAYHERKCEILDALDAIRITNTTIQKAFEKQGVLKAGSDRYAQIKEGKARYASFEKSLIRLLGGKNNKPSVFDDKVSLTKALGEHIVYEFADDLERMQAVREDYNRAFSFEGLGKAIVGTPHFLRFSRVHGHEASGLFQQGKTQEAIDLYVLRLKNHRTSLAGVDGELVSILQGFSTFADKLHSESSDLEFLRWKRQFLLYCFKKGYLEKHRDVLRSLLRKHPVFSKIGLQRYTQFREDVYDLEKMEVVVPRGGTLNFARKSLTFPQLGEERSFSDIFSTFHLDVEIDLENSSENMQSFALFLAGQDSVNKVVTVDEDKGAAGVLSKDTEYMIVNAQGQQYVQNTQTDEFLWVDTERIDNDPTIVTGTGTYRLVSGYPREHDTQDAIILVEDSDTKRQKRLQQTGVIDEEKQIVDEYFLKQQIGKELFFRPVKGQRLVFSQSVSGGVNQQTDDPFSLFQHYQLVDTLLEPQTYAERTVDEVFSESGELLDTEEVFATDSPEQVRNDRWFGEFTSFEEFFEHRTAEERKDPLLQHLVQQYKHLGATGLPAWVYQGKTYYNASYFESAYGVSIQKLSSGGHGFRFDPLKFSSELKQRLKIFVAHQDGGEAEATGNIENMSDKEMFQRLKAIYPGLFSMPYVTLWRLLQDKPIDLGSEQIPSLNMLWNLGLPESETGTDKRRQFLDELRTMKRHESMHVLLQFSGFSYAGVTEEAIEARKEAGIAPSLAEKIVGDTLLVEDLHGSTVALTHEMVCRIAEGPKSTLTSQQIEDQLKFLDEAFEPYVIVTQDNFPESDERRAYRHGEKRIYKTVVLMDRQGHTYELPLAAIESALQQQGVFARPGLSVSKAEELQQQISEAGGMSQEKIDELEEQLLDGGEGFLDFSRNVAKLSVDTEQGFASAAGDVFARLAAARSEFITQPITLEEVQQHQQDRLYVFDESPQSIGRNLFPDGIENQRNVYPLNFSNLPADQEQARQEIIHRLERMEKFAKQGSKNTTRVFPREADGGRVLIGDALQAEYPQLSGLIQNSLQGIAERQNQGETSREKRQPSETNQIQEQQRAQNQSPGEANNQQHSRSEDDETETQSILEQFDEMFGGDPGAKLAAGPVKIIIRTQSSDLDGGGSDWGVAIAVPSDDKRGFVLKSIERENWTPITFTGSDGLENFIKRTQKKVYTFKDSKPNLNEGFLKPFQEQSFTGDVFKTYPPGREGDKVALSGGGLVKKVAKEDGTSDAHPITHVGILPGLGGSSQMDPVRYAVDRGGDSVDVTLVGNPKIAFRKRMTYDEFAVFVADKNLQPYTQEEHELVAKKVDKRKGELASGFRLVSLKSMLEGFKELKETRIDDLLGNRGELDKLHFMKALTGWLPDGAPLNLGMLKSRVEAKMDAAAWQKIQKFKGELSGVDGGSDSHAAKVTDLIATQIFEVGSTGLLRDKKEFKRRAAGYLLYAIEGGGPYIRGLAPYATEGRRVGALFGEAKRKEFLELRAKEFGLVKNADTLSDRQLDQFVKMELRFIHETAGSQEFEPLFGTKFHRAVEDAKDSFSGVDKMNDVKESIANKGNVDDAYVAFAGSIKNNIPKAVLGAFAGLESLVEDDYDYKVFYQSTVLMLISGFGLLGMSKSGKDAFAGICRKRGIPLGLLVGDAKNPKTTLDIIDYISRKEGVPSLTRALSSGLAKEGFNDWTPDKVTPETRQKPGFQKAIKGAFDNRWNSHGDLVMNAFNVHKSTTLIEYEFDQSITSDEKAAVQKYVNNGLYNGYKDYKERIDFDGNSPFYQYGILNVAPGTFESILFRFNSRGEVADDRARDMWNQLGGKFAILKEEIEGAGDQNKIKSIYKFAVKRVLWYFGEKLRRENLEDFKKAIKSKDKDGEKGYKTILESDILFKGERGNREIIDDSVIMTISNLADFLEEGGKQIADMSEVID